MSKVSLTANFLGHDLTESMEIHKDYLVFLYTKRPVFSLHCRYSAVSSASRISREGLFCRLIEI